MSKPKRSCLPDGTPVCTVGGHPIGDDEYFYTLNSVGGYGRDEVLCCEACIKKPENSGARERMRELGAKGLD